MNRVLHWTDATDGTCRRKVRLVVEGSARRQRFGSPSKMKAMVVVPLPWLTISVDAINVDCSTRPSVVGSQYG